MSIVDITRKPWGQTFTFTNSDRFKGSIVSVLKGRRTSLHYHKQKDETIMVVKGKISITLDGEIRIGTVGCVVSIGHGCIHRIEALKYSEFIEVSSGEKGDKIRVEDDYKRV